MPQISQITAKHDVDSRYSGLMTRQVPSGLVDDEKSNSNYHNNEPLQFMANSLIRIHVGGASSTTAYIRRGSFKVASQLKHSDYDGTSTCSPACRGTSMSLCRSHSMIDLSSVRFNLENCSFRKPKFEKGSICTRLDQLLIQTFSLSHLAINPCKSIWSNKVIEDNKEQLQEMIKKAANLICHALMLNAWRRRREEIKELCEAIRQFTQQIDHLQLQTVVLRRLLGTENNRVGQLGVEIQRTKTQLENVMKENTGLAAEKYILENENEKLKAVIDERMVKLENYKNELLSSKSQLKAVESQIMRNQEKLSKLREEKKFLLEKISMKEIFAAECGKRADQAVAIAEDLRRKLEAQIGVINKLQEDKHELSRKIEDTEAEKIRLNECMLTISNTERASSLQVANLTTQLYNREAALRRIESAYNTHLVELNDLRRQRQRSQWCQVVLQIAGRMARAPQAFLRTLLFLSPTSTIL